MLNRNAAIAALLVAAGIVYLSLYPFEWRVALPPSGPVAELLRTWRSWPESRGNFIANVILYLPWGFFAALALAPRTPALLRVLLPVALGALLSVAMELSQFYIAGRFTDMSDVYANATGSLLGALAAVVFGGGVRLSLPGERHPQIFPSLLLASFLARRLYPYVPVIDLHKYLQALRPVYAAPRLAAGDLFVHGVVWLVLAYLVESLFGRRSALALFLILAVVIFAGQIMIVEASVSLPDLAGAALALALWFPALRFIPGRIAILALLFAAVVTLERLAPFRLSPVPHGFSWVPFLGTLRGTIESGLVSFLDKFFLYGGLIWLLAQAGLRLWRATVAVMVLLFFCSAVERYLPGRSAEITDTAMALLIGVMIRLTGRIPVAA